jgi:hypothetical protein
MNRQIVERTTSPGLITPRKDLVRTVMAEYAGPIRKLREYRAFGDWLPQFDLRTENPEEYHRRIAKERWSFLPDFRELLDAVDAFNQGWAGSETDEARSRVMIGLMLDGLPSAKTLPSASYVDALVFILSDDEADELTGCLNFQPLALAAAVAQVWKTSTFAPSPAEFLALARKKRSEFYRASKDADRLYNLREQAEQVLLTYGDIRPEPGGSDDDVPF